MKWLELRYCTFVDGMFKKKYAMFAKEKNYRSLLPRKLKSRLYDTKTSMYAQYELRVISEEAPDDSDKRLPTLHEYDEIN